MDAFFYLETCKLWPVCFCWMDLSRTSPIQTSVLTGSWHCFAPGSVAFRCRRFSSQSLAGVTVDPHRGAPVSSHPTSSARRRVFELSFRCHCFVLHGNNCPLRELLPRSPDHWGCSSDLRSDFAMEGYGEGLGSGLSGTLGKGRVGWAEAVNRNARGMVCHVRAVA